MITKSPADRPKLARDLASAQRRKKGLDDQLSGLADEAMHSVEPHELENQEKSTERVQLAQTGIEATVIDAAATGAASGAAGGAAGAATTTVGAGAGAAGAAAGAGAGAAATSVSVLTGATAGVAAAGAGVAGAVAGGGGGGGAGDGSAVGGGTLPTWLTAPADSRSGLLSPNPSVTSQRWTSNGPGVGPYTSFGPMTGSDPYVLDGSECNDTIIGAGGNDTLFGRGGADRLLGGGGKDQMDGGDGIDTVDYSYLNGVNDASLTGYNVKVELRRSNKPTQLVYDADGNPVSTDADSLSNIENVIGSRGNDTITGDKAGNVLDGGRGNDLIFGDNVRDTQRDRISDTFNDTIIAAGGGNDTVDGMFGINTLSFRPVDATNSPLFDNYDPAWALENTGDAASLTSADGSPGNALSRSVVIDLNSQANSDGFRTYYFTQNPTGVASDEYTSTGLYKNINNVVGSEVSDLIAGDSSANILNGSGGIDIIYGGGGEDSLYGGEGDDWVVFKPVMGGPSTPTSAYDGIIARLDSQIYTSGVITDRPLVGFTNVLGSEGNDTIIGASKHAGMLVDFAALKEYDQIAFTFRVGLVTTSYTITIGSGAQTAGTIQALVDAEVGAGKITVTTPTDGSLVFTVTSLADSLTSLQANLYTDNCRDAFGRIIYGDISSANNILVGEAGKDVIYGGDDADRLFGGATGGEGADTRYMNSLWGGKDKDIFFVGYNYNPVVGTAKDVADSEGGTYSTNTYGKLPTDTDGVDYGIVQLESGNFHDLIEDWQRGDSLYVAQGWTAVIHGLGKNDGTNYDERFEQAGINTPNVAYDWSGKDEVDLRTTVFNDGLIRIAAGASDNKIWGSQGNDEFRVGYQWQVSGTTLSPSTTGVTGARDIVWEWDDQGTTRDTLYVADGSTAIIGGLLNKSVDSIVGGAGWTDDDLIDLRSQVTNLGTIVLAAGQGTNTLYLNNAQTSPPTVYQAIETSTAGSKHQIHVGYVSKADHTGTTVSGGSATDTIYGWNSQAWGSSTSYESTAKTVGTVNTADLVYDTLTVAAGSTAIIRSLAGMDTADSDTDASRWTGTQTVDLRPNVANAGTIIVSTGDDSDIVFGSNGVDHIYGGSGDNFLTGWVGNDHFFVGYDYDFVEGKAAQASVSTEDQILDWETNDFLTLAKDSTAIISSLYGMNPYSPTRWNDNDTVDLRSVDGNVGKGSNNNQAADIGKIVALTGAGNDAIYGSNGNDWIYAEGGLNLIHLGAVATNTGTDKDGADRVFITEWSGQYEVRGFDSDDSLYISKQMLDAFFSATVSGYAAKPGNGFNVFTSGYSAGDNYLKATDGPLTIGEAYSESTLFPTSQLVWDAAYKDALGDYYTSNGAWSNLAHYAAEVGGRAAVSALSYGYLALAGGLVAIPFVGPFLAIPVYVIAGLTIADAVQVDPHRNATYTVSAGFGDYVTEFGYGRTVATSDTTWNDVNLLSFFNIPNDRFAKTLEILSTPYTTGTLNVPNYTPYGATFDGDKTEVTKGIANLVTVFNGTETFVYLVYSDDWMIQENEVKLLAQINGRVTADQLVIYDASTDPYMAGKTPIAPVLAPKVQAISLIEDDDEIAPAAGNALLTSDPTPTVSIQLTKALLDSDRLVVKFNGVTVLTTSIVVDTNDKSKITVTLPEQVSDGVYLLNVSISNEQGFSSTFDARIGIDANPIEEEEITVQSTAAGLTFGFRQDDSSTLEVDESAAPERATVFLTLDDDDTEPTTLTAVLKTENGFSATLDFTAPGFTAPAAVATGVLSITDALGRTTDLDGYSVTLGTVLHDTITGVTGKINFLYGFDGNDNITASTSGDFLYGGAGADTLTGGIGDDYLNGGAGNDTLTGGAGKDTLVGGDGADAMTGGTGADLFIWNAIAEFGDTISDFVSGEDQLVFSASELGAGLFTIADVLDSDGNPLLDADGKKVTQNVAKQLTEDQFDSGADVTSAKDANVRFFLDTTKGDLYFDADGSGTGSSAALVATLTNLTTIVYTDILLV